MTSLAALALVVWVFGTLGTAVYSLGVWHVEAELASAEERKRYARQIFLAPLWPLLLLRLLSKAFQDAFGSNQYRPQNTKH